MTSRNRNSIIGGRKDSDRYDRMGIRNGWDLSDGETPPVTGRKKELARAYELLVLKTDEEYEKEAEITRQIREKNENARKLSAARTILGHVEKHGYDGLLDDPERNRSANEHRRTEETEGEATSYQGIAIKDRTEWKKGRRRIFAGIIGLVLLIIVGFGAIVVFGPAMTFADMDAYKEMKIEVVGIQDEPVIITVEDLKKMPMKRIRVNVHQGELGVDDEPERGIAVGPTLDTFLGEYGRDKGEFRSMRVYTASENSTAYVKTMKEREMILSIADGNHPLGKKNGPLRIAVAGEDVSEWSGGIRRIVFTEL